MPELIVNLALIGATFRPAISALQRAPRQKRCLTIGLHVLQSKTGRIICYREVILAMHWPSRVTSEESTLRVL